MNTKIISVIISQEPSRLDLGILETLRKLEPSLTRGRVRQWFQEGKIHFQNRPAKASDLFTPGKYEITLVQCELKSPEARPSPEGSFLPILYEDEDILILNKKSGTPSIPHSEDETNTAVNSALAHFPELAHIGKKGFEPGLLHRLDTGTSGILAFAKNEQEFQRLRLAWKSNQVTKFYRAISLVLTPLPKLPLRIDTSLGHDSKSAKKMIALIDSSLNKRIRGKPLQAITHILSAKSVRFSSETARGLNNSQLETQLIDFEIQIETGVMHQIRCHLDSKSWSIVGDPIYHSSHHPINQGHPSHRLWLHAWKLRLPLKDGKPLFLEAQLPDDWPS